MSAKAPLGSLPRLAACLFLAGLATLSRSAAAGRPNVIIVLTDDQGYGDLSCHGNPVLKTPHLDRLQTWFYDADGKEVCGAYYVYVRRK